MANGAYLRQMHRIFDGGSVAGLSEGQLLERFITRRDETAFEALVARHGPMVFGVCRRILRDPSDAEDAFQATFLVLVRQARTIRGRDSLGGWLHRVAYRVAVRASSTRLKPECIEVDSLPAHDGIDRDLVALIHDELNRLPSKYRDPIILCDLENHTHEEAAQALHWPLGTVKGRLSRARNLLKERLIRRGVGVPAVALGVALGRDAKAIVSPALLDSTVRAAMGVAASKTLVAGAASAVAVGLAQGVLRTMFWKSAKLGLAALVATGLIGVAGVGTFGQIPGGGEKRAVAADEPKQVDPAPPPSPSDPAQEVASEPDPNADLRPTARALLGTWKVLDRQDGDIDEIGLPFNDKIVITRDKIQLGQPGEADLTYDLQLLQQPKVFWWSPAFGPYQGKNFGAAFAINGDRLTIAYSGLDHEGVSVGSTDNNQPGGDIFVVKLERVGTKPSVASPDADITKLQGSWFLKSQVYRHAGRTFVVDKLADQTMYGQIGGGFFVDRYDIRDNQSTDNAPPVVVHITQYDGGATPKQMDISTVDDKILPRRGIPTGKAIYSLEGNRFTICYDPIHPHRRPQSFLSLAGDATDDTRVQSIFERVIPAAAEKASTKPLLQGRWKVISVVENGEPFEMAEAPDLLFTDSMNGRIMGDGRIAYYANYRIDPTSTPNRIDFDKPQEPSFVTKHALYKLDGDDLLLCIPQGDERPTELTSEPGSKRQLLTLRRIGPVNSDIELKLYQDREASRRAQREKSEPALEPALMPPPALAAETYPNGDIRGRWKLVSRIVGGRQEFIAPWWTGSVFTDDSYGELNEKGLEYKARYRVKTEAKPWQIEYLSQFDDKVILAGIYKVEGDRLTICQGVGNRDEVVALPSEFESKVGSCYDLLTFQWVGPVTEETTLQMQQSQAAQREAREEQQRKLTQAATNVASLPPLDPPIVTPAPVDSDAKQAELEIEVAIVTSELADLKGQIVNVGKLINSDRALLKMPIERRPEIVKKLEDGIERREKELESLKKYYVAKSKELSRLKQSPESPALPAASRGAGLPTATQVRTIPASERLADFDRQIRLLQQKRDAFLMSLPEDQRQALLKQLAP